MAAMATTTQHWKALTHLNNEQKNVDEEPADMTISKGMPKCYAALKTHKKAHDARIRSKEYENDITTVYLMPQMPSKMCSCLGNGRNVFVHFAGIQR